MHPAPRVSASVGGIIPGAVIHHRPAHELATRVVRVSVVVEKIRHGEAAQGNRIAVHGTRTGQLVRVARHIVLLTAELKVARQEEAREVQLGRGRGHTGQFSVSGIRKAANVLKRGLQQPQDRHKPAPQGSCSPKNNVIVSETSFSGWGSKLFGPVYGAVKAP